MQIVLPGALPEPAVARELAKYLPQKAPTLTRWFEFAQISVKHVDTLTTGCTAYESWLLDSAGFEPREQQNQAAGLAPLRTETPPHPNTPVWLAELVHVAPSRDGAVLLPAQELHITEQQSVALFESALKLFDGTGFTLHPDSTEQWRVTPPLDFTPLCASPALVSMTSVNDWWPQALSTRPWRRLFNELQMLWFDHPVNTQRQAEGLPAINSVWLYGGAARHQFRDLNHSSTWQTFDVLDKPAQRQDWGEWLDALAGLEADVFQPLAHESDAPDLILVGRNKIISASPSRLKRLTQWLPGHRHTWRKWWSHQN